jgi:hypothetical protein
MLRLGLFSHECLNRSALHHQQRMSNQSRASCQISLSSVLRRSVAFVQPGAVSQCLQMKQSTMTAVSKFPPMSTQLLAGAKKKQKELPQSTPDAFFKSKSGATRLLVLRAFTMVARSFHLVWILWHRFCPSRDCCSWVVHGKKPLEWMEEK